MKRQWSQIGSTITALVMAMVLMLISGCQDTQAPAGSQTASQAPPPSSADASANQQIPSQSDKSDIVIAVSCGVTGNFAAGSQKVVQGVNLAVKEYNEAGGLLDGRKISVVVNDDQCVADMVINSVNKLATMNPKPAAIIGPMNSSTLLAAENLFKEYEIASVHGATSPVIATTGNPYLFRVRASDAIAAKVCAKALVDKENPKKVGILYNNDELGTGGRDIAAAYFDEVGVPYIAEGHNLGDKDMSGQLTKFKNEGVDALFCYTHDNEIAIIGRQLYEMGMDELPVYTNPIIAMTQVLDLIEPEWFEGWCCVTDFAASNPDSDSKAFTDKFTAEYGEPPEMFAASYYGAAVAVCEAIKVAGTDDAKAVAQAMSTLKGVKVPVGMLNAKSDGDMVFEINIATIKNKVPEITGRVALDQ